jgi:MoaA/NifB/PqqE/SkfB family radical SAM enzyme
LELVCEAAQLGVREWHIAGGGEPMYLPALTLAVMGLIKKFDMLGILTTNGTLWKREHVERAVKMGWDRIHFSIDGPDARTQDYLRNVPGTFRRVVRTIGLFRQLKKRYKMDKPALNMNTVLSVKNYRKLPRLVEFAHRHGIEYMFVDPLIVYSEWGERLKLKEAHLAEFPTYLREAMRRAEQYGISTNFTGLEQNLDAELINKSSRMHEVVQADMERAGMTVPPGPVRDFLTTPCYKPWWHMTIKCDGRTTSCDVPITGGDNVKDRCLAEVWTGPYFTNLRKGLRAKRVPDFCAQCNPSHTTQRRRLRTEISHMLRGVKP